MSVTASTSSVLAEINLLDLDRWAAEGAPHDWFAELRREAPVWRHPGVGGSPGFWVVSGYDEVVRLGRRPEIWSSEADNGGVTGLGKGDELERMQDRVDDQIGPAQEALGADAKMLLTLDPPEHTLYRKIVNKGFTPRMIGRLEPQVRELVGEHLDRRPPGQPFDLVTDLAMPVPLQVIADMLGAPRRDHAQILAWSNQSVTGTDPEYNTGDPDSVGLAILGLVQYFGALREQRAADRTEDLVSVLLDAEVDGHSLSTVRFSMFLFLLAVAGNETTRNAMSHGVLALAEHPEQFDRLVADPSLIPTAVEEILRWSSPVLYFRRNVMTEVDAGGQRMVPGDAVSLWYISANRDEARFDDPFRFDVGRSPNHHIAFGGGGPHFCLGASLARLELRVLLEELVARAGRIEVVGPVERLRSNFIHGIRHLPVRLA